MKLHLCKSRRRSKGKDSIASDGGEIFVDESDTELNVDDIYKASMGTDGIDNAETSVNDEMSLADISDDDDKVGVVCKTLSEKLQFSESTIEKMKLMDIPIDILRLEDIPKELNTLQKQCTNKLKELMSNSEISMKCVETLVPNLAKNCLAITTNCGPVDKLLSLGTGCFGVEGIDAVIDSSGTEIRLLDSVSPGADNKNMEPPTLKTGLWLVDTINNLLDRWSSREGSSTLGGGFNIYKLLNIAALLKHLGDASSADVLKTLGQRKMLAIESIEKPKLWRQILSDISTPIKPVATTPLPTMLNPHEVSLCKEHLTDIPNLDHEYISEYAFKIYWKYTEKWLREMIGPSFKVSKEILANTKSWFLELEEAAQKLFIKMSKTLCCNSS